MPEGWSLVWILRDGTPSPVRVRLGDGDDDYLSILDGDLSEGDLVIIGDDESQ